MNITQLSALSRLFASNPAEAKALIKLASVDILKSLGEGKYTIALGDKTLSAQSEKPLLEGMRYWTQLTQSKNQPPILSKLIAMPQLLHTFDKEQFHYTLKELQNVLTQKTPASSIKQALFENLANASTKEEFTQLSHLLLSMQHQVLSFPLLYSNTFALLQFKKRYNNKTKKQYLEFYAALELLGPISGIASLSDGDVALSLNVAYEKTKQFLENDMKNFSYTLDISLSQNIEPLYEPKLSSLLDLSI
ncbi:MAG: hypothetical protein RBR54_11115 [Sulfurimonas sp.]|jgi:hypothetical protein|nr:hypothetical protein [Sulfurimonas sp.]